MNQITKRNEAGMAAWFGGLPTHQKVLVGAGGAIVGAGAIALLVVAAPAEGLLLSAGGFLMATGPTALELAKNGKLG